MPYGRYPLFYGIAWDNMGVNGILQNPIDLFKIILRIFTLKRAHPNFFEQNFLVLHNEEF